MACHRVVCIFTRAILASTLLSVSFNSIACWAQQPANTKTVPATPPATGTANAKVPATQASSSNDIAIANQVQDAEHAALRHLIESIEPYHPAKQLKGAAVLSGSTTMMELGKQWADRFRKFHTEVKFDRGVDGTEAAIKALAEDPTVIAGLSRPLTDDDKKMLQSGKCKDPLAIIVALDPLALYVNKANPIVGVTPDQLESIFRAPNAGQKHAATWGDLGVQGEWAAKPIRIHGRSEISGTQGFIKQLVIRGGELATLAETHKSNEEVCKGILADPNGVGLSGFGEAIEQLKPVSLILNGVVVPANEQSFLTGQYPLVRPLVLVVDKEQMKSDGGLRESILRYVLSRDGQLEAVRAGFYPLDPAYIRHEIDSVSGPQMR